MLAVSIPIITGLTGGHVDAFNHVMGFDGGIELFDTVEIGGEMAWSYDKTDNHGNDPNIFSTRAEGTAYRLKSKTELFKDKGGKPSMIVRSSFTHMGDNFRPRLSNYRNTRRDEFWGKHISFDDVSPDFTAFKIGDGIDIGRDVYQFTMENVLLDEKITSLYDMRFVRGDGGRKIEDVYREELTVQPFSNLTGKFLFRYQDLPGTTIGEDPFIITDFISADNTDELLRNAEVTSSDDADVWTCSFGFRYDPMKWLGLEGIYERTTDYDIFPQMTLNDAGFRDLGQIREFNHFVWGQGLISLPDYDPYNIYKGRIYLRPFDNIRTKLEYVINEFKHATGRDDNISHWGVEVDMDITKRLSGAFKYTRSQLVDLFRQAISGEDLPFHHHNNIFAELRYDINANNQFIVSFGEFYVPVQYTPVSWILNTVDTQRIVRMYLKGVF